MIAHGSADPTVSFSQSEQLVKRLEECGAQVSFICCLLYTSGIFLHSQNSLEGSARIQKDHLLRALGNVVQNAIEHTPEGGSVYLEGLSLIHISSLGIQSIAGGRIEMEGKDVRIYIKNQSCFQKL